MVRAFYMVGVTFVEDNLNYTGELCEKWHVGIIESDVLISMSTRLLRGISSAENQMNFTKYEAVLSDHSSFVSNACAEEFGTELSTPPPESDFTCEFTSSSEGPEFEMAIPKCAYTVTGVDDSDSV